MSPKADKMSKSRGNVVNPDDIVEEYGADALRLYEMFMGPLEVTKPWSMTGVDGVRKFLDRAWRIIVDEKSETMQLHAAVQDIEPSDEQNRVVHKTIKAVTNDLNHMGFNTVIARLMEFVNFFTKETERPKSSMETLVLMLSPLAPHISEELWQLLGHSESLAYEPWPEFDESLTVDDTIEIPVQVNGKVRSKVSVAADASKDDMLTAAKDDEKISEAIASKQIVKSIVVPGRLVNLVVK